MKILFIGDIVGRKGREVVRDQLPLLKEKYKIDFVIANAENAAHGKGLTKKIYEQLISFGIDFFTLGNHAFSKKEINEIIHNTNIVRPLNMEPLNVGSSYRVVEFQGIKIGIGNVLGEVFLNQATSSPYEAVKSMIKDQVDIRILDIHGETTSEKITLSYQYHPYFNAILGTHTHVQTADERLIGNCAFISDVGMCGPFESILGRDKDEVILRTIYQEKTHYTVSNNPALFCAVIIHIDENFKTTNIERIQIRPEMI